MGVEEGGGFGWGGGSGDGDGIVGVFFGFLGFWVFGVLGGREGWMMVDGVQRVEGLGFGKWWRWWRWWLCLIGIRFPKKLTKIPSREYMVSFDGVYLVSELGC